MSQFTHLGQFPFILILLAACGIATPAEPVLTELTPPEHLGMDEAKLREARDYALTGGGSGCILRGGRLVMAWGNQQLKYDLYSTTKSIGITALGLALIDGKVRLDDQARTYLPEVGIPPEGNAATPWLDELTLFHLATQTGGFEKTRGWGRQLYRPGTRWLYSDGGPNWLADCLTAAYGRDLLDVMRERVFDPLGITVAERRDGPGDLFWGFNNLDRPQRLNGIKRRPFGAGIHANAQAMAKLGYLYLRQGKWDESQLLSASFVRMATEPAAGIAGLPVDDGGELYWSAGASQHYGLLWWNNADGAIAGVPRDAFWSYGMKDSFIIVIPSLDIVAVRTGDFLRPRRDPGRSDSYNYVVKPLLLPICQSVANGAPYPPSPMITSIAWSPVEGIIRFAQKADTWPITWADDGNQYTAFGDGWGFVDEFPREKKLSLGFSKIVGGPPQVAGTNIPSDGERSGGGAWGEKASGMLMVEGVLYMWVRNAEPGTGQQSRLAWSTDHAKTWTWSDWKFAEFGYPCFLNFGPNYADARDGFVYVYSPNTPSAYYETDAAVFMRVPKTRIRDRAAYEFFKGLDAQGQPVWTADVTQRGAVFQFPGGCNRMDVTYNAGLGRYLMVMRSRPNMTSRAHLPDKSSAHGVNQFSIYDAPEPWGPWTTVYYTEQWEGTPLKDLEYWQGWGESAHLPAKWMTPDGKSMQLLFAGGLGGFSVRAATLTIAGSRKPVLDARWRSLPDTHTGFVPNHYKTREAWEVRRAQLKKQILWSAGLSPMPERTPLHARIFDRIDRFDYTVEKVCFESAPGFFVTGNLYRSKNPSPRGHPGILNPHGHALNGRLFDSDIASYQARCITHARMGGTAFMWDMVDYNDSAMQLSGKYEEVNYRTAHKSWWNHERDRRALWNVNSLGLQLWNSISALDFLESLPEVDPARLASTGESGGGTQTFLLGAVDDRLKVAAPVCMAPPHLNPHPPAPAFPERKSDDKRQISEVRCQMSEARGRKPEARGRKPKPEAEARSQTEGRGRKRITGD